MTGVQSVCDRLCGKLSTSAGSEALNVTEDMGRESSVISAVLMTMRHRWIDGHGCVPCGNTARAVILRNNIIFQ